jgi:hypothetical protein
MSKLIDCHFNQFLQIVESILDNYHIEKDEKLNKIVSECYTRLTRALVEQYGTYTAVNGQIRAVYPPYCYRDPGRWFTTVCNENTVCIRPYTVQNGVLYTVPIYGDQDYGEIRPIFVPYLIVNGRIRRSYD